AVLVTADGRRLVALGEGGEDGLPGRGRELDAGLLGGGVERVLELLPVFEECARQVAEELAEGLLLGTPRGLLLRSRRTPLLRLRERLKALLLLEAGDTLRACLEVEAQRPLDGDLAEAEVRRGEDPAHHDLLG